MVLRYVCLAAFTLAACGCAPLNPSAHASRSPPASRLPTDAVVLDVAFLRLRASDTEAYRSIWDAADEQHFPAEVRVHLAANGLRAGIYGQQLPSQLRELLDAKPSTLEDVSEGVASDLDIGGNRQHLPVRAGHRSIIKASRVHPTLAVLLSEEGNVHGHQLSDVRCIFSLKPYPLGDGRVKLGLTPEIEHGESKTRWTGGEGMLIQQTGQERLILDKLRIDAVLSPGQSLILSGTSEIKGLGEYFFSQPAVGTVERRLLLIRFSQTQFDDLFAPAQTSAPLATPGE